MLKEKTKTNMLLISDLKDMFNRGDQILKRALLECQKQKINVLINNQPTPIVQVIKPKYHPSLALVDHPLAIAAFKEFCATHGILLNPKSKRKGMLGAIDLHQQFAYPYDTFNKLLSICYQQGRTFQTCGTEQPLVELCLSGSKQVLALHEDKNALEIFRNICAEQNTPLISQKKQPGMLSAADLSKQYQKSPDVMNKLLEKCYHNNMRFRADFEMQPLVQKVKSGNVSILALNKHPDALLHFIRFAASEGILLKKKTTQSKDSHNHFFKIIKSKIETPTK